MSQQAGAPRTGIAAMPPVKSSRAPFFDGEPSELKEFLELFGEVADGCQLTDADKATSVVRYTEKKIKRFWMSLPGYEAKDWPVLKASIIGAYPGADKGVKYTRRHLEKITKANVSEEILSETDLLRYYQEFRPVAKWLENERKISTDELDRYFWYGLHPTARVAIRQRIEVKEPAYTRDKPPTMDKVLEHGRYVYSDDAFDAEFDDPIATRLKKGGKEKRKSRKRGKKRAKDSDDSESDSEEDESSSESESESSSSEEEERRKKKKKKSKKGKETVDREVRTKKVTFDDSARKKSDLDDIEELTKKLHGLRVGDAAYAGCYARLVSLSPAMANHIPSPWQTPTATAAAAPSYPNPPNARAGPRVPWDQRMNEPNNLCYFCRGESHRVSECPIAAEYTRAGRTRVDENGFHVHSDGSRIRRHPDGIKAAIDQRWGGPLAMPNDRQPPPHLPAAAANFFEIFPEGDTQAVITEVEVEVEKEESEYQSDDEGEDEFVWGAIEELEMLESEGFAVTRAEARAKAKRVEVSKQSETKKNDGERDKKEYTVNEEEKRKENTNKARYTVKEKERVEEKVVEEKEDKVDRDEPYFEPRQPAYHYESKAADPQAASKFRNRILEAVVPNVTVGDLVSLSGDLRKEIVEYTRTVRIAKPSTRKSSPAATSFSSVFVSGQH